MRKIKNCKVCGKPCVGRVCRNCYETKSNRGKYGSGIKSRWTQEDYQKYRWGIETLPTSNTELKQGGNTNGKTKR